MSEHFCGYGDDQGSSHDLSVMEATLRYKFKLQKLKQPNQTCNTLKKNTQKNIKNIQSVPELEAVRRLFCLCFNVSQPPLAVPCLHEASVRLVLPCTAVTIRECRL